MARRMQHAVPAFERSRSKGRSSRPQCWQKSQPPREDEKTRADYRIPKGLTLRDEIARYFRIGQAQFRDFARRSIHRTRATIEFIAALLRDVFGFADVTPAWPREHRWSTLCRDARSSQRTYANRRGEAFGGARPRCAGAFCGRAQAVPALALQDWLNAGGRLCGACAAMASVCA